MSPVRAFDVARHRTSGSPSRVPSLMERSTAATDLLTLAKNAPAAARDEALARYAHAMVSERSPGLRASMYLNFRASRLKAQPAAQAQMDAVRDSLLPAALPVDEWLANGQGAIRVHHYVMADFCKDTLASYRAQGFHRVSANGASELWAKTLVDPQGKRPPVELKVKLKKTHERILRDLDNPKVDAVVYSGHSMLGGVLDSSLAQAPSRRVGKKLLVLFNCRGKQNAGELLRRFPGVHLVATDLSAYDADDQQVLRGLYDGMGRRSTYREVAKRIRSGDLIQGLKNYLFPDDPRLLACLDLDQDGVADLSPIGADDLFDPRTRHGGNRLNFSPSAGAPEHHAVSGAKVDHALRYANTAFFYFAEENHAAPISLAETDRFVSAGWYRSDSDQPIRVNERRRGEQVYLEVAVNSRYAPQSKHAIATMVLFELQRYLCLRDKGQFTEADRYRALLLVGTYVNECVDYLDDCAATLAGFSTRYGYTNVSYALMEQAMAKENNKTGRQAAIDLLKEEGVSVSMSD